MQGLARPPPQHLVTAVALCCGRWASLHCLTRLHCIAGGLLSSLQSLQFKLHPCHSQLPQGNEWELHATPEDERVILLWNGRVQVHPLPVALFPGGHVAFVQRSPWRCGWLSSCVGGWGLL